MMTFLYVYVTDSSCADVCGSVDWRCSSSETDAGEYVLPREDGDVPPRVPEIAASATQAAGWKPTMGHGEVVGDE